MKKLIASMIFFASLSPLSVLAYNAWFMTNTPFASFTSEDITIFTHAVDNALNHTSNGKKLVWSNPHSGATGYLLPLNTTRAKGTQCRELEIYNEAKGVTDKSKFKFCKISGEWKIVS